MAGDYIPPNRKLYLTPDDIPIGRFCRQLAIPDDPAWVGLVDGVLSALCDASAWRPSGTLTPEEAAAAWTDMLFEAWALEGCGVTTAPTPFWDEDTDVEDEMPADTQPWYGYVTDPSLPPGELNFIENLAIWGFTGFLAVATWEIGAAPAILFHTIAPKFALAMRRADFGEIIRILVDGQDSVTVDTSSYSPGDVIRVPITADPAVTGGHDVMIIQVS